MSKWGYAGLFMITLATLMYEVLLTRIFSVTLWYHFAFMAISLAMFGMTAGAIWVYLGFKRPGPAGAKFEMGRSALLFGVYSVLSILIHLRFPFLDGRSPEGMALMAMTFAVISLPFFFSGVSVCLALTRFPREVSKLYAADLAGAASGCVLLIYALKAVGGPAVVFVVALLASGGALLFSIDGGFRGLRVASASAVAIFALLAVLYKASPHGARPFLQVTWAKGKAEPLPLYEQWNSFSRITVSDDPGRREKPFGWGLSPSYTPDRKVWQLFLRIDSSAETILTRFNGDWGGLDYLKYDITNIAHYVRPDSRVLVVGAGGGRDVLSALVFGQKSVLAVEINEDIIRAVNETFGDFTGHLDRYPNVRFVNDEARSYIARSKEQFDILQVSLIDTWAATAAGAFVLTENSLYTTEAWKMFLRHLSPRGVLSFSRWYYRRTPVEMYRVTSLATASLLQSGVRDPRNHIVIMRCMRPGAEGNIDPDGVGTALVSKAPFTETDLERLEELARRLHFDVMLSPRAAADPVYSEIASGTDLDRFAEAFPFNITPPRDDCPFFFHLVRLSDVAKSSVRRLAAGLHIMGAVSVLAVALVIVLFLTLLCIIVPLALTTRKESLEGALPHFVFFAAIGLGFIFVEISQMQRLIIFLGHPTYGLSVVLFSLLLSSGLGSYSTERVSGLGPSRSALARLILLVATLSVFGVATPRAIEAFQASATPLRVLVATLMLSPIGVVMGMAFPLGIKLASRHSDSLTPWLWGINGATSVCGSVLAVAVSLNAGISATFWTGFACYGVACGAFVLAGRKISRGPARSQGRAKVPASVGAWQV